MPEQKSLTQAPWRIRARYVRRFFRRLRQQIRYRRSLYSLPVIFANSFPKSGTHLLTQILQAFTEISPAVDSGLPAVITYEGDTARQRELGQILADLKSFSPGDIGYGHLHAQGELIDMLSSPQFAAYFVLRDPRDVVVSHVHYVTEMETRHALHDYYAHTLQTFEQRLSASIVGLEHLGLPLPDIFQRFEPFLGWLEVKQVLTLRYEDLMQDRKTQLQRILEHASQRGLTLYCPLADAIQKIEGVLDPQRSPTFRKGKIGGWRESFTEEHKQLFKEISGDLLIRLGYEQNKDW